MEKENTLEKIQDKITSRRRDGNTTRLIDNAIQILFSGKICVVLDHHECGRKRMVNKHLFDRILRRLEIEHRGMLESKRVKIDKNNFEFSLVEEPIL